MSAHQKAQEIPLEGWKEIAGFFQRDESTVRRWEREEGLPIRRHEHKQRSSVYAYPAELEAWRENRGAAQAQQQVRWRNSAPWAAGATAALLLIGLIALSRSPALGPVAEAQAPGKKIQTVEVCDECDWIGSVSPDGRTISETDWRNNAIGLRDFATGDLRLLTTKGEPSSTYRHVFSPNGEFVAFGWNVRGKPTELRKIAVSSSGEDATLLYSNEEFLEMQAVGWSASDEILVAAKRADWTTAVGLVPAQGGDLRVVKTIAANNPTLRISPNGKWIAYDTPSKDHAPLRDVYLLSSDGSMETRVTNHEANEYVVGFTPGSEALLFASKRTGSYSLWAANILENGATPEPRLLQRDLGPVFPLTVNPDGAFYYARAVGAKDVFTAEVDWQSGRVTAKPAPIEGTYPGSSREPRWAPDGSFFVYRATESVVNDLAGNVVRLVIRTWPEGREREILPADIALSPYYEMHVSPDGGRVMVRARDLRGRWGLYAIELEAGGTQLLMQHPEEGIEGLGWDESGNSWFYRQQRAIYHVEPGAEQVKKVYSIPESIDGGKIVGVTLSPRRDHIAFRVLGANQVWVGPLDDGDPKMLYAAPAKARIYSMDWTPGGQALLAVVDSPEEPQHQGLYRFPIDGGPAVKTELLGDRMSTPYLHPDGRVVLFDDGATDVRIWRMENYWSPDDAQARTE